MLNNLFKLTGLKLIHKSVLVNPNWIRGYFSWLEVYERFLTGEWKNRNCKLITLSVNFVENSKIII